MTKDPRLQEQIDKLLAKNNQFSLEIKKYEDVVDAQEKQIIALREEISKLSEKISMSKTSLVLLREEIEEMSLEIKHLLQKNESERS